MYNPIAQLYKPDREIFASIAVAALPLQEQSLFIIAKDAGAEVDDPPIQSTYPMI